MINQDYLRQAESVARKISVADPSTRLALHPEFRKELDRLTGMGLAIPERLRQLNSTLDDEAVEAWFDNMPV